MSATAFKNFDASVVLLKDSNLIEASAGTGKTYSIALLVLRLILEEKMPVKEILMVTFTKAAVAELQERIRLFIRNAYTVSQSEAIAKNDISDLVVAATERSGREAVQHLLKEAVLFLDETSVLTIHGFCQQTLNEFAFETNQLFGADLLQDTSAVLQDEVIKFWRKNITTIPVELLSRLQEAGLTRESINRIVKDHLDGKMFLDYDKKEKYSFCEEDHNDTLAALRELIEKETKLRKDVEHYIVDHQGRLKNITEGNSLARRHILPLIDHPEAFIAYITRGKKPAYVKNLYQDILDQCENCDQVSLELAELIQKIINKIYCFAISQITAGVELYKQRNNQMSFDDLIVNLHSALVKRDNPKLVAALRKKYKAVFIDEFQDTDRLQYEIFQTAFGRDTILFYIGDPKQSIYAWRKADIFTYFKAKAAVHHRYEMNHNYRSSKAFIDAMNLFFLPEEQFDTFYFENAEEEIEYVPVKSPENNLKGILMKGNAPDVPITISAHEKKELVCEAVAAQIIDLLENKDYLIAEKDKERSITPSDIGVLVRSNAEGKDIKKQLSRYGIPAVTIGDDRILTSEEAKYLLYLLLAITDISRSNINKALLSPFTGYNTEIILSLSDEKMVELFRKFKVRWDEDGVYAALMDFVHDFQVQQVLLQSNTENGERVITNLFQLIELLHKVQANKKFSPMELIGWLQRGIEGMETEGDEYEQRIESDEEAIKIVTIHKSKGLEYKIVLAPFLDFTAERKNDLFYSFRNESGEYVSAAKPQLSDAQMKIVLQQAEQENRRLLYVAITRAVYKCFIFKNLYYKESTITSFLNALSPMTDPSLINWVMPPAIFKNYYYSKTKNWQPSVLPEPVYFSLQQNNWSRMSYSMLASHLEVLPKNRSGQPTEKYDHFVFKQLVRGAKTGNLLHYLFENIHYTNSSKWPDLIAEAVRRFAPQHTEIYSPMLREVLDHVLHVPLCIDDVQFSLADVDYDKRIHEFEFDFPVLLFRPGALEGLSDENIIVSVKSIQYLEGVMNGLMDLFFEYKSRYYILDWKSNFLGDTLEDYHHQALAEAMNENNYHLQYLIYTLAAKKYLESRLPVFDYETQFGGVIYLFVRGIRKNLKTGIFLSKPSLKQIDRLDEILSIKETTEQG